MTELQFEFPKGLKELSTLERKYRDWGKTPEAEKEKMTALALANRGLNAIEPRSMYTEYLTSLSSELNESYVSGTEEETENLLKKVSWLTGLLNEFYSDKTKRKRRVIREEAEIYCRVEKLRSSDSSLSIKKASNKVAQQIPHKTPTYVNTRYYKFRKKYNNMPPEEVVKEFNLSPDLL